MVEADTKLKSVTIYTDGGCIGNPGQGGYGVVLLYGSKRRELSGAFRKTTNNRMEIMAAIAGLQTLRYRCAVTIYTDSQYLADSIMKGWAARWQANGWKRNQKDKAVTPIYGNVCLDYANNMKCGSSGSKDMQAMPKTNVVIAYPCRPRIAAIYLLMMVMRTIIRY